MAGRSALPRRTRSRAASLLKKRSLTNLYNEHPAWLDNAHRDLGACGGHAAYG